MKSGKHLKPSIKLICSDDDGKAMVVVAALMANLWFP